MLATYLVVIFVSLFCTFRSTLSDGGEEEEFQKSLYSPEDPILELSVNNFNQSIFMKDKAFFVEFYSSWCGHCINFAPIYRDFANNVSRWRNIVEVGAINCALDANLPVCQEHDVNSYPTIKYYKYLSRGPDAGERFHLKKQTVNDLVLGMTQMVVEDFRKHVPSGWPNLSPINDNIASTAQLWGLTASSVDFIALIFEPVNSTFLGAQAALEFFLDQNKVAIKIVTDKNPMARQYGFVEFPALVILKKTDQLPFFVSKSKMNRQDLNTKIRYHTSLIQIPDKSATSQVPLLNYNLTKTIEIAKDNRYFVHKSDLISSISYLFYHEIAKFKHISKERLGALKQFLEALSRYFPGTESESRFLFRLISWLNEMPLEITSEHWKTQINLFQEQSGKPLIKSVTWVNCKGSKPKFRGFPCSLWTLFHTLTVNAYKMDGKKKSFKPLESLSAISGFVQNFFGCKDCADNFAKEAAAMKDEVTKPTDVVLWLWKVHNRVNNRLKGQATEDPEHPKIQFPPADLCRTCFDSTSNSWNENEVLTFLLNFYTDIKTESPGIEKNKIKLDEFGNPLPDFRAVNPKFKNVAKVKQEEKNLHNTDDLDEEKKRFLENRLLIGQRRSSIDDVSNAGAFTNFDFSLCFLLWFFSAGSLILLFIFFKFKRGRYKFMKNLIYSDYKA